MKLQPPFRACFAYIVVVVCIFDTSFTTGQNRVFIEKDNNSPEVQDSGDFVGKAPTGYVYFDTSFLAKEQANALLKEKKTDKSRDSMPVSVRRKQDEFGRKITNFLNTGEELRNYSKNGYISTSTGDVHLVPKELNTDPKEKKLKCFV